MRKLRLFQRDGYFSIDFLAQSVVDRAGASAPTASGERTIEIEKLEIDPEDALLAQLRAFVVAVRARARPVGARRARRSRRCAPRCAWSTRCPPTRRRCPMTHACSLPRATPRATLTRPALVRALRARRPGLRFVGLGGAELEKAGVEIVVDQRELAVGGLVELLPELPARRRAPGAGCGRALRERGPSSSCWSTPPDFNLPFARRARRAGVADALLRQPAGLGLAARADPQARAARRTGSR